MTVDTKVEAVEVGIEAAGVVEIMSEEDIVRKMRGTNR